MTRPLTVPVAILTFAVLLAACGGDDPTPEPEVTPTTRALTLPATTLKLPTDSEPPATTPEVAPLVIGFEIRHQEPGEGGDVVVALIDPGLYTDIDLQTLLEDVVVETGAATVHLVDSADIVDAVATGAELDEGAAVHYLALLENGAEVTFLGPFADYGGVVIGS